MASFIEKNFPTLARTGNNQPQKAGKGRKGKPGKSREGELPKGYKPSVPALPEVNLLPEQYIFQAKRRNIVFKTVMAAVVIVGASVIGYGVLRTQATLSNTELTAAKNNLAATQGQLAQLQPIQNILDTLEEREAQEGKLLGPKLSYSKVLSATAVSLPASGEYLTVGVEPNFADPTDTATNQTFANTCSPPLNPFETEVVVPVEGCLKYSGTFPDGATALLTQLNGNLSGKNVLDNVVTKPGDAPASGGTSTQPGQPAEQRLSFTGSAWIIDPAANNG